MKRFALLASVVVALLSGVLLARVARSEGAAPSPSPVGRTIDAAAALEGSAGWHYRHSQPTHWRSTMLQP